MKTVLTPFANKPLKMAALIFVAMIATRIAGEFGAGFVRGLMAELSNGI